MQMHMTTTPFGRRPVTLGQLAGHADVRSMPDGIAIDKWKVFRSIREARALIGATDRSLAILNALLSFHPKTELLSAEQLIVWPSNEQLTTRANGMSATTLRRHLSVLVDCGLIIRRDSPNGKRFARKGRGGEIEQAYGFDLAPILRRAEEFEHLSETVRNEKRKFKVAKERLTLLRRDIIKMVEAGIAEAVPGDWDGFKRAYQEIIDRLPRSAPRHVYEELCEDLSALWENVFNILNSFTKQTDTDAKALHSECHIQDSDKTSILESEPFVRKEVIDQARERSDGSSNQANHELSLDLVLTACPDLSNLIPNRQIRDWRDFLAAAEIARPMLEISPSAWRDACDTMGDVKAAIMVAAILQRSHQINSSGGYLRRLTEKAREKQFSTWPMIMALLRTKRDNEKKKACNPAQQTSDESGQQGWIISDTLRRYLSSARH